jgi:hypothetical protein
LGNRQQPRLGPECYSFRRSDPWLLSSASVSVDYFPAVLRPDTFTTSDYVFFYHCHDSFCVAPLCMPDHPSLVTSAKEDSVTLIGLIVSLFLRQVPCMRLCLSDIDDNLMRPRSVDQSRRFPSASTKSREDLRFRTSRQEEGEPVANKRTLD